MADRSSRCWTCSSKEHLRSECPSRSAAFSKAGGSGGPGGPEENEKGKGKKGGKGKTKSDGKGFNGGGDRKGGDGTSVAALSSPGVSGSNGKQQQETSEKPESPVKGEEGQKPLDGTGGSEGQGGADQALMKEVTSLLKSMRTQEGNPRVRAVCEVKSMQASQEVRTLIDGGATHCLRQAKSRAEWNAAVPVRVFLATGEAQLRQNVESATLLVEEAIQPIIPVSKLVEGGYVVSWCKKKCEVEHGSHGKIPIVMVQGCPTVSKAWGEKLMMEIEDMEKKRAKVRAILECSVLAEDQWEKEVAELRTLFPEVPSRILEQVPGESQWDSGQIPLNRRKRRQLEKAKYIVINMFSGGDGSRWSRLESNEVAVLNIDILTGFNVMDPHVAGWIDSLIATGKVCMWTSGPPCRSVSICRFAKQDGGPPQLRGRSGQDRFGLEGLSEAQQDITDHDSVLWLKNLRWMRKAKMANKDVGLLLEQPLDPAVWKEGAKECPTFTNWPETLDLVSQLKLEETVVDQGAVGHEATKPTVLYNNLEEVQTLHGLKDAERRKHEWPQSMEERVRYSKSLASWAPGLVEMIVRAGLRLCREGASLRALTSKEKQEVLAWESHFASGHVPYRRDCLHCLESMGRDRQRRRIANPEGHCLSLDLAGPFQPGVDQERNGCRYLLMGVVTIPILQGEPLPEGLRKMGFKRPKEEVANLAQGNAEEATLDGGSNFEDGPGDKEEGEVLPEAPEEPVELLETEVQEMEIANQRWREFIKDSKKTEVKGITWGVPVRSRATKDIIEGVSKIYGRFRALQIPMYRVHCDRAREFISGDFKRWAASKDMMVTYSAGDEPTNNARIEREIGLVKSRTRLLIKTTASPITWWPLAARHALEERCRSQLLELGVPTPALLPFGAVGVARKKTWFNRSEPWKWPQQRVRCWGPAADMSVSSQGQYLQTEDGHFVRSTVVTIPSTRSWRSEEIEDGEVAVEGQSRGEEDPAKAEEDEGKENLGQIREEVMVLEDQEERQEMEVQVVAQKRRRLQSKTPRPPEYEPELFSTEVQKRGEWQHEEPIEGEMAQVRLMQHLGLQQLVQEEVSHVCETGGNSGSNGLLKKAKQEIKYLEEKMKSSEPSVRSLTAKVEEEVLQTRVVPLDEVRRNLDLWKPAFEKEVKTLTEGPVKPMSKEEVQRMKDRGEVVEILPMLAIASKKPPNRLKSRIVCCGNFAEAPAEGNLSVGGVCSTVIRTVTHLAASYGWSLGTIDVTGAFLQAPRRPCGKVTFTQPPTILQALDLVQPNELWRVDCALYGLQESPSDWSSHRDDQLRLLQWEDDMGHYHLEETAEKHLWKVKDGKNQTTGFVMVYVDDFLVATSENRLTKILEVL